MRALWLVIPGLAGLITGCASVTATETPASSSAISIAAPAPVPGYDWFLTPDNGVTKLAYGVEASDDLRLGLDCVTGSGKVAVTAVAPTGTRDIHLEAGGETGRFRATAEPSELHGGDLLTAETRSDAPVLLGFRRLGWIAQTIGERREVYVPQPGSEAGVERFFMLCG